MGFFLNLKIDVLVFPFMIKALLQYYLQMRKFSIDSKKVV